MRDMWIIRYKSSEIKGERLRIGLGLRVNDVRGDRGDTFMAVEHLEL